MDKVIVPALGKRKVKEVGRADIARLHHSRRALPYDANRTLATLSKMFTMAEKWDIRPDGSNPCRHVEKYPERKRERMLTPEELAALGDALAGAERTWERACQLDADIAATLDEVRRTRRTAELVARLEDLRSQRKALGDVVWPQAVAAIRLLVFTGARMREVLGLRWEWIDFERGMARLPDSKTGAKTVHLPPPALALLAELPRVEGNPHVIVGAVAGACLVDLERPWQAIRKAASVRLWRAGPGAVAALVEELAGRLGREPTFAECQAAAASADIALPTGLNDVRIHDLRHAFASVAASSGLGLPIIGKMLGHTQAATTARYAHLAPDPVAAAAATVAGKIADALGGMPASGGEVVRLPKRKA